MKNVYRVEIGTINGYHAYKVITTSETRAKAMAIKRHKELGRKLTEDDKVFAEKTCVVR